MCPLPCVDLFYCSFFWSLSKAMYYIFKSCFVYSTTEEYLLSAGNVLSRGQLRSCLHDARAIHREFWDLPSNHPEKAEVAGSGMKNRYRSILPNERSRVRLPVGNEDLLAGYINANYVRVSVSQKTCILSYFSYYQQPPTRVICLPWRQLFRPFSIQIDYLSWKLLIIWKYDIYIFTVNSHPLICILSLKMQMITYVTKYFEKKGREWHLPESHP